MKHYKHLTPERRYQISSLLKTQISQSEMARILGASKSTISRELRRNRGNRGYRPKQAQSLCQQRKANNSKTITAFGWAYNQLPTKCILVWLNMLNKTIYYLFFYMHFAGALLYIEERLSRKYSPEQITGRLRYLGWEDVPSHERIYQYIYADKKSGGKLHKHLRCQKKYRKRGYTNHDRRGQLSERIDISQRPAEARQRLGDYEGDTVIGKGHKGALVTLVDRATREVRIQVLPNRKAELVCQACIELLAGERAQSITFDNSKEFAQHRSIAEALDTEVYFALPYHSWARGSNENANGLIRQFLPKSVSLDNLTAEFVQAIEDNLNNRPRKVLGFQTPLEVKSRFGGAALRY